MTYRAGVIGCGRIGCSFVGTRSHAGSYMAAEEVDLVAVCDLDKKRAEGHCANAYQNYLEMLDREDLDIVSVCTPPESHGKIVCDIACSPGVRAIYCEKPIAPKVPEAEYMIRLCDAKGVLLVINHQRRFSPMHQEIARTLREGELGQIQKVTCYYGGGVANTGSHLFDLLRFYLGEIQAADGWWSASSSHKSDDPNMDGLLRFEGKVPVVLQACDNQAYAIFEINLLGREGRLRVTNSGYQVEVEWAVSSYNLTGARELQPPRVLATSEPDFWIPYGIQHILDCLETGEEPISSGEDGLAALKIIEALTVSAQRKGK